MARSQVTICNLALGRVGETTRIESLDDDSTPAVACKLLYEECLRQVLEVFPWPFATKQAALTAAYGQYSASTTYAADTEVLSDSIIYKSLAAGNLGNAVTDTTKWALVSPFNVGWIYAYVLPDDCITPVALLAIGQRVSGLALSDKPLFDVMMNRTATGSVLVTDLTTDDFDALEYVGFPGTSIEGEWVDYPPMYSAQFVETLSWILAARLSLELKKDQRMHDDFFNRYLHALSAAIAHTLNSRQLDIQSPTSITVRE